MANLRDIISLLTVSLTLFMVAEPATAGTKSDTMNKMLDVGSQRRSYTVHVPRRVTDCTPVVFVLHGFLATRSYAAWDTEMSKYADDYGFIAVYPLGVGYSWNAGDCCGKAFHARTDDINFIRSAVADLESKYKVDKRKIFAAGFSNGAMLCYRIAQELPDIFAGVALVEGSFRSASTSSNGPVSVLIIHDEKDKVFPIEGGTGHWLSYKIKTTSITDTVNYWVKSNECATEPKIEKTASFEKQTYSGGKDSTAVCLYKLKANGHVWPGGRESRYFHRQQSPQMSASKAIVDFFLEHPKTVFE